ncbi:MAG: response regulator [Candidatus Rokuibacteriota bacterium]
MSLNVKTRAAPGTYRRSFAPVRVHLRTTQAPEDSTIKTILVVDPMRDVVDLIRDILESRGYAVLATTDPAAALTLLDARGASIDLLLTDVVMPIIRGRDLAGLARERHPAIRLLLMTGHPIETLAEYSPLPAGVFLIGKPFTLDSMVEAVRRGLESP